MTRPNRIALGLAAAATAVSVAAAPALAGMSLPEASNAHWTEQAVTGGHIAQIKGRGEGRFAVACTPGDKNGQIIYRVAAPARDEVRKAGDVLPVTFTFDNDEKIERRLHWVEDGAYWTDPFRPSSPLSMAMRKSYNVRINAKDHAGVVSEFTLKDSYKSIEAMFAGC